MTEAARATRRRGPEHRVEQQPAFVLHTTAWRETSLVVEIYSRDHGRLALAARGAKRPTSQFRGMLSPFCPLSVSWSGRGEVKTLVRAEWLGGMVPLRGEALLAGFYVNELMVRLLPRDDAHERLFAAYVEVLRGLAQDEERHDALLRCFELELLAQIGYGLALDEAEAGHDWVLRAGHLQPLLRGVDAGDAPVVSAATVRALAARDFRDAQAATQAKGVLRSLIRYHLGERPLNTRRILQDLKSL
ncbi:MAG: DNA repair protein RecO [Betaproteobacteria bacterium]